VKKGDMVRPKPGTCEGDEKSLGLAIIVEGPIKDPYQPDKSYCKVQWVKDRGRRWTFYIDDLILVSEGNNESR